MLPGSYQDPKVEGRRAKLGEITYGVWNEDAYQLYMDVETLNLLLDQLDPESLRADKVAHALEQFTLIADFEQPLEARIASYRAAREALKPALDAVNGATAPVFYAIGNAHLDLAWLVADARDPSQDRAHVRRAAAPARGISRTTSSCRASRRAM